ncbi:MULTISPECIES: ribbon-helix-helix domain-containing protein [Paenibacillus]|uniref:ribbon-helix-helix domain-containing protein n=1 Tax=Paenibacillus TaxID=44249 RepID=UPI00097012D9|nr:hypothetical protein [Paenibacillus odorifer]
MAVSKGNSRIMVTLPQDLKNELERRAEIENRSISNLILTLLQKQIRSEQEE